MNVHPEGANPVTVHPPRLIHSISAGFNAVANNLLLIVPSILLDLLLWFGPHLRIKQLVEPMVSTALRLVRQTSATDLAPLWENMETVWGQFLEHFNLTSLISTIPIGIPALMISEAPLKTPYGQPVFLEMGAVWQVFLLWIAFTLAGLLLGTLYFAAIARTSVADQEPACDEPQAQRSRPEQLIRQCVQVIGMVAILFIAIAVVLIPTITIASFLSLASPLLGQALMMLVSFSAVWFFVPLIFTPHGIFVCGQNVLRAMVTSARVVRFSLPGTGMFLVVTIILYQGLAVLWSIPPDTSWMRIVGIVGHAFISAGLLSASFYYFRGGLVYAQSFRRIPLPQA